MYGESTWLSIPVSCFLVNFSVNNLYRIQYAVDTIPPADTPRTCVNGERPMLHWLNNTTLATKVTVFHTVYKQLSCAR